MNEVSHWDPRGSGMISPECLEPVVSQDTRERALILGSLYRTFLQNVFRCLIMLARY